MLCPRCCAEQGQDGLSQVREVHRELRETERRAHGGALWRSHAGAGGVASLATLSS